MTAIRDGNWLRKREDHMVLLADIREDSPPWHTAMQVIIDGMEGCPALKRDDIAKAGLPLSPLPILSFPTPFPVLPRSYVPSYTT